MPRAAAVAAAADCSNRRDLLRWSPSYAGNNTCRQFSESACETFRVGATPCRWIAPGQCRRDHDKSGSCGRKFEGVTSLWFAGVERAVRALPSGSRVVVLDVGANDGDWSAQTFQSLRRIQPAGARLRLVMFEPQPWFVAPLSNIVASSTRHSVAEHVRAAAWTQAANLTFYVASGAERMKRSRTATLVADHAAAHRNVARLIVEAIDLAEYLLRVRAELLVLKLDVEGAEFALVPELLRRRALCRVTHLRVEWHLSSMPLGGNGTRLLFEDRWHKACAGFPTPAVMHEDW